MTELRRTRVWIVIQMVEDALSESTDHKSVGGSSVSPAAFILQLFISLTPPLTPPSPPSPRHSSTQPDHIENCTLNPLNLDADTFVDNQTLEWIHWLLIGGLILCGLQWWSMEGIHVTPYPSSVVCECECSDGSRHARLQLWSTDCRLTTSLDH